MMLQKGVKVVGLDATVTIDGIQKAGQYSLLCCDLRCMCLGHAGVSDLGRG